MIKHAAFQASRRRRRGAIDDGQAAKWRVDDNPPPPYAGDMPDLVLASTPISPGVERYSLHGRDLSIEISFNFAI